MTCTDRRSRLHPSFWAVVIVATSLVGCGGLDDAHDTADNPTGGQPLAQAQSNLSVARWFYSWGEATGPDADLGPDTDRTCFLSGVAGILQIDYHCSIPDCNNGSMAGVYRSNGHWYLRAHNPTPWPVNARAICIGTVANRTDPVTWSSGAAAVPVAPVTANRQCFLTKVTGGSENWVYEGEGVGLVRKNNPLALNATWWYLTGTVSADLFTGDKATASAACVDMPAGTTVTSFDPPAVPDPGSHTTNLVYDSAGALCGLRGVSGPFVGDSWTDGALISWPASFPGTWTLSLTNGKGAHVTCMQ
jgi:hypothetical protein